MEFRVSGFNRLYVPSRSRPDDAEAETATPTAEQVTERSKRISDIALNNSLRKKDPEFSRPLSSALTLFGVAGEPKATKVFDEVEEFRTPREEEPSDSPTREDLENLRGAVVKVAKDYLQDQPTASLEDLEGRLNDVFGDGFTDLVKVRRVDQFNGQSEIHFEDFDFNNLVQSEKDIAEAAVKVSKTNFEFSESGRESNQTAVVFEDTSFVYESNRYSLAFSPTEVAESSVNTDSADFLASISRR